MSRLRQGAAASALLTPVSTTLLTVSLIMSVAIVLPDQASAASLKLTKPNPKVHRSSTSQANNARNATTRASRSASGRSALGTGGSNGPSTPAAWHKPPPMPADLRRSIAQGARLKPIPVKLPDALPGELKLSRHLTRVSVPPGLGRVVPTQPLTQAQRDSSLGRGYTTVYRTRLRRIDQYLEQRNGSLSRHRVLSSLQAKFNSTAAQSRAASGRSVTRMKTGTGQSPSETPANWQKPPPMPADLQRSIAQGVALKPIPVKLPDALPGELKLSRHLTRVSVPPGLGRVVQTSPTL